MASRTQLIRAKAKVGSLEAFLSELFRGFERERIEYALARDYGPLPASLDTRDLDLLVGEGQLERAYQVVKSVAQTHSSNVLRINQESSIWLLVIRSDLYWGLRVDLATPDSHTWRGVCHLGLDRAFQRKVCESGIYSLQGRDIVFMQLCRDIMGSLKLREKYRSAIRCIYFDNPQSFEVELGKMFGRRCAATLSEACRKGNFEDLKVLGKQMRRAVIVRGLMREPLRTTGNILRYLGWRCREYVRPNGVMVAVIGPDGSGKGSLIEKVKELLTGSLHFPPQVYHWRPGLLPSLGSLLLGRKDDGATATNPHAKKPSGLTFSLLRLAYYTLDYVFGYWLLVRPSLGRKSIAAIFDRYFYDCLFDPARFRISLPPWVVRAFGIFVPRPDLVILLSATPEVIYSRKSELPLNEIYRQFSEMDRFAKYMGNCVYINSCGPLEDSAQDMSGTILSTLGNRLLRSCRIQVSTTFRVSAECSLLRQPSEGNERSIELRNMPTRLQLEAGMLQRALEQFLGPAAGPAAQSRAELLNPATHPAPARVVQEWSRRAVEELAKNGFAHFRRFSVLPSRKAPRWLLPLDDGRRMLQGFQIYTPHARSGAMLKATASGFIKAGWNGWGRPCVLIASKERLPLEGLASEVTGEPELTFAMSLGFGGNFRKLTVQVMRPNGAILGYIKLPLTEAATERIRHEAATLQRLWSFPALRPHIPKVLYAGGWAGGFLLFQSTGPHCPGPVQFGRLHEVFLRTLWGVYRTEKPGRTLVEEVAAHWQKSVSLMDAELPELGERALERASRDLDGSMVPCGISQGDFAPWNTRIEHERLFVFDWELAAWDAPILWDQFHFHIQVMSLLNKNSGWWDPSCHTRTDRASFLLYLLSSVCWCLEEAGSGDPGTEFRKRILLRYFPKE